LISPREQKLEPEEQTIDVRDLIWRVRRYRWLLILPLVVCVCGAAVLYRLSTPIYSSQVVVSIDDTDNLSPALAPLVHSDREAVDNPRERVTKVDSKIRSRAFLGILAERLGMTKDPILIARANTAMQRVTGITRDEYLMRSAISLLGSKISVSPGRGAFIRIVATDGNPENARKLAGMIGDVLVEESRQRELSRVMARGEFSSDQIVVYQERLKKAEDALRAFQESKIRRDLSSGDVTQDNLTVARSLKASAEEEMEQLRSRIQAARNDWRATQGDAPLPDLTSSRATEWTDMLGSLETNYALAQLRGGANSATEAEGLRARITGVRQALFAELGQQADALGGNLSSVARSTAAGIALDRAVLRSLTIRRDRLSGQIGVYQRGIESSPRDELELQRLREDVQNSRDLLLTLQKEATSSRLSEALAASALGPRLNIVEHPLLPLSPSSPKPLKIFGVAFLLGILAAVGIVFAMERLALVLRSTEQAEAEYGVRVIGTMPRIEGWTRPGTYLQNNWAALAILLTLFLTGVVLALDASLPRHQSTASQTLRHQ
jgi:polysaccharide biosynthesis transport protein